MRFGGVGGVLHCESRGAASVCGLCPGYGRVWGVEGQPHAIADDGTVCRLSWGSLPPHVPAGASSVDRSYSTTNEGLMNYRTMKKLDSYAFWGAVAAFGGFLWWIFTSLV